MSALLLSGCGQTSGPATSSTTPEKTQHTRVHQAPDRARITLTGRVVRSDANSFDLDYGGGVILVEMDDFDWMMEGSRHLTDESVIVHGRIDDDFYEQRSIEASSVYVKGLGTQFYASAADEEELAPFVRDFDLRDPYVEVAGQVTAVNGRSFDLQTNAGPVHVDTELLPYNPLDDEGYQVIDEGDRVRVRGRLDAALFDTQDLTATMVVSLQPNESSS